MVGLKGRLLAAVLLRMMVAAAHSSVENVASESFFEERSSGYECVPSPMPNCSAVDMRFHEATGERFERPPNCKLVVIVAGMPRTGSTLLIELVHDAVRQALSQSGLKVVNISYWRLDRHLGTKGGQAVNWRPTELPDDTDVIVTKTHEYDSEVLGLCERNLVILSSREPAAQVTSVANAFLKTEDGRTCENFEWHLKKFEAQARCWQEAAHFPLKFAYEDFSVSKVTTTISIATVIETILGIDRVDPDKETVLEFRFPKGFAEAEANPGIPGLRKVQQTEEEKQLQLQTNLADFLPEECRDIDFWRRCFPYIWNRNDMATTP